MCDLGADRSKNNLDGQMRKGITRWETKLRIGEVGSLGFHIEFPRVGFFREILLRERHVVDHSLESRAAPTHSYVRRYVRASSRH